jgi:hypothetical protein
MFCSNYSHGLNLSLGIPPQKCNGGEGGIRTHGTVTRTGTDASTASAEQAVDISGVQPKVAVMSLTLNRPECNEHNQQYAHQTHGFVAPLSTPQFNRMG